MPRRSKAADGPCSNTGQHTEGPDGYADWHLWAMRMAKTHEQSQCRDCGLWKVWERRLPPP